MDTNSAWTLVKAVVNHYLEDMREWHGDADEFTEEEERKYRIALSKVNQFINEKLKEKEESMFHLYINNKYHGEFSEVTQALAYIQGLIEDSELETIDAEELEIKIIKYEE